MSCSVMGRCSVISVYSVQLTQNISRKGKVLLLKKLTPLSIIINDI